MSKMLTPKKIYMVFLPTYTKIRNNTSSEQAPVVRALEELLLSRDNRQGSLTMEGRQSSRVGIFCVTSVLGAKPQL